MQAFKYCVLHLGYEINGYGSCKGDSGSPVVQFVTSGGFNDIHYKQVNKIIYGIIISL